MGQQYVANYDVVAKAVNSDHFTKQQQHVFRRWVPKYENTQSSGDGSQLTHTGNLVKELLNSSVSTSKVSILSYLIIQSTFYLSLAGCVSAC